MHSGADATASLLLQLLQGQERCPSVPVRFVLQEFSRVGVVWRLGWLRRVTDLTIICCSYVQWWYACFR